MEATEDSGWAWARYEPGASRPWTLALAGHLYRRAAFGASWRQLQEALSAGPQSSVDRLLGPTGEADSAGRDESLQDGSGRAAGVESLRAWWLRRMLETDFPLREKLTLFWHGRFGISMARVKDAALMAGHVEMLREHALGSYRELLQAAAQDPAVYLGLNAEANRKALPNPNVARHFLDRLSVGRLAADEQDVTEAARAFTGWFVLQGRLRFFQREHDVEPKTVLGRTGDWQANDVVRIALDRPEAAQNVVRDLWRLLISEVQEPASDLIAPLVEQFAEAYDIRRLVETMLRSNLFFSPVAYRQRVKSPVEYALGIVSGIGSRVPTLPLGAELAALGQALYDPPTTGGWAGGRCWLNPATIAGRHRLARSLLQQGGPYGGRLDPSPLVQEADGATAEASAQLLIDVYLQGDLSDRARGELLAASAADRSATGAWLRAFTAEVAARPEFHLA